MNDASKMIQDLRRILAKLEKGEHSNVILATEYQGNVDCAVFGELRGCSLLALTVQNAMAEAISAERIERRPLAAGAKAN